MPTDQQALLLQVSADISKLQRQFDKANKAVDDGSKRMEKRAKDAATNLEKYFGKTDVARAMDKVFDSTRFKVLDSGVAKIGLMGSALESLGPYGVGAAAAIGAVAAALGEAREALRFADELSDTANRLHITTDALQEYRAALHAAGGDEAGADQALESFSETLGMAQAGMKRGQRAFLELGFTPAQIKGFADADEALKAVTERIAGLPSQQQDAVIKQLGLEGMKPLIESGADAMQRFRDEAHKAGVIMDSEVIKNVDGLNDKIEDAWKKVDVQLKTAFIGLGPVILDAVKALGDLLEQANKVVDAFNTIEHKRTESIKDQLASFQERQAKGGPVAAFYADSDRKKIAEFQAELARRAAEKPTAGAGGNKPTHTLNDPTKAPPGPRDDTDQRTESVNSAVAGANRDLLQAQGQLTDDIEAHAAIERQIAAEELAQATARLEKQKADIDADKGISDATKVALKAKLDEAETTARKASEAKVDLINRQADWAAEDRADETRKALRDAELAQLDLAADLATTQAERNRIEAQIAKIKEDELLHEQGKALSRAEQTGAISDPEGGQRFQVAQDAARAQRQQGEHQRFLDANPLAEYASRVQDLNSEFQNDGVQAIEALSNGLGDAIVNAKSLGDVAANVFKQLLAQIISQSAQAGLANLAASFAIPGFASGTSFAPGGLALVGERGPELVNLPRGSQVLPNDVLQGLTVSKGTTATVLQPMNFDLRGAVMTQDLLNQMNQIGARARVEGAQLGKAGALQQLRQNTRQRMGR